MAKTVSSVFGYNIVLFAIFAQYNVQFLKKMVVINAFERSPKAQGVRREGIRKGPPSEAEKPRYAQF